MQVYELAADTEAGIMYALMTDGEVKVYDAAGPLGGGGGGGSSEVGGPLWACQVITHDPSPRSLGTETREQYRRWREGVGLDDNLGPGKRQLKGTRHAGKCPARIFGPLGRMLVQKSYGCRVTNLDGSSPWLFLFFLMTVLLLRKMTATKQRALP